MSKLLKEFGIDGKWIEKECFSKNCWCSTIFSDQKDEDGDDICIISSGAMPKQYAQIIAASPKLLEELIDSVLFMEKTEMDFINRNGINSGMETANMFHRKIKLIESLDPKHRKWNEIKELL